MPNMQIEETLESLANLLRTHGVTHWASWVETDLALVKKGDAYGLTHLLQAFGGMGSLNDLVICPENGHHISQSQVKAVNDRLSALTSSAHTLATSILRGLQ